MNGSETYPGLRLVGIWEKVWLFTGDRREMTSKQMALLGPSIRAVTETFIRHKLNMQLRHTFVIWLKPLAKSGLVVIVENACQSVLVVIVF